MSEEERAEDRHREAPLKAQRDVEHDEDEGDDDGVDRALRDLAAEARRDVLHARRGRGEVVLEAAREVVLLRLRQRLRAHLEARVAVAARRLAAPLDDGVPAPDRRHLASHLGQRRRRRCPEGDLRAALEVDAEVQALDGDREHAEDDRHSRDGEPDPAWAAVTDVDSRPAGDRLAGATHEARVVEPAEATEEAEHGARRERRP